MRITRHAEKRSKQRIGLDKRATHRLATIALDYGLRHQEVTGKLRDLFGALYKKNCTADNVRIYSQKIFIFCGLNLVTVLPLHNRYKKMVAKAFDRRKVL